MKVNLYTTVGCHLCEQALHLLHTLQDERQNQGKSLQICEIDIADEARLMERYNIRIPVITSDAATGDIGWPFSQQELKEFLNA